MFLHTAQDTIGASANDFGLARDITRAFVASAATLAAPVDLALTHVPLADTADAGGPYPLAVTATSLSGAGVAGVEVHVRVDGGPEQVLPLMPGLQPGSGWAACRACSPRAK